MNLLQWLTFSRERCRKRPRSQSCQLRVEQLDERIVPVIGQLDQPRVLLPGAKFDAELLFYGYNPDSIVRENQRCRDPLFKKGSRHEWHCPGFNLQLAFEIDTKTPLC
jgi:hypothetical protein